LKSEEGAFGGSGVWLDEAAFAELEAAAQESVQLACPSGSQTCAIGEEDRARRQRRVIVCILVIISV
jgi:hypothetical protein